MLERELDERVLLVAVMLVNNEIGVIQPVAEIARMAHDAGALMLCDAVQGLGRVAIPDGPDLVAVSAHKIHGPKGIGALWMRKGAEPAPLIHGGGQERGLRSGTLSPALVRRFWRGGEAGARTVRSAIMRMSRSLWIAAWTARTRLDHQRQHRRSAIAAISISVATGWMRARLIADLRDIAFSLGQRLRQRVGPAEPCAARAGPDRPRGALVDPPRVRPLHDRGGDRRRACRRIDAAAPCAGACCAA